MHSPKRRQTLIAAGAALLAASHGARAQEFPNQPMRTVVPYPPGGIVDPVARLMGIPLASTLGQPNVIDNRPGAAGAIGIAAVAQSRPDGHTLLFHSSTMTTSATVQHENAKIDVRAVLTPVAMVGIAPFIIVVNPNVPAKTLPEFIAYAKANPGKMNFGSSGKGSSNHLGAELFKRMAGIDLVHVPFQGGGPMDTALVGGQIQMGFDTLASMNLVRAGRLRVLAVTSMQRAKALPDVPTVHESGVPNFDLNLWLGYFAPAATPRPVIDKLANTIREITARPETLEKLATFGLDRSTMSTDQFAAQFRKEIDEWDKLLKSLGAA